MRRLYPKFKSIYAWRWHKCVRCQSNFRLESGWYGWYDEMLVYNLCNRIKRYLCEGCTQTEYLADQFFARYQWIPGDNLSIAYRESFGEMNATTIVAKPNIGRKKRKEPHPDRYEILKGNSGQ